MASRQQFYALAFSACLLAVLPSILYAQSRCRHTIINAEGPIVAATPTQFSRTAGRGPIVVNGNPTLIVRANPSRCLTTIANDGGVRIWCSERDYIIEAGVGIPVDPNSSLVMGAEGQQAWHCVSQDGSDVNVIVGEAR